MSDQLDVFTDQVANHVHVVREQRGQVENFGPEKPAAAEREQPLRQVSSFFGGLPNLVQTRSAPNPKDSSPAVHRYSRR